MGNESPSGFDRRRSRRDGAAARRVKVRSTESIPLSPPDKKEKAAHRVAFSFLSGGKHGR